MDYPIFCIEGLRETQTTASVAIDHNPQATAGSQRRNKFRAPMICMAPVTLEVQYYFNVRRDVPIDMIDQLHAPHA